jgi:hypothetical protein
MSKHEALALRKKLLTATYNGRMRRDLPGAAALYKQLEEVNKTLEK